ncbi:hypothetical protein [uncultured Enterococcus sp.]|uniref:hypothetical protein n=1 Tax=uncultured Enterococcus sp. TaxID=167972 RepID=UPI002AA7B230|nr:hypothetical protein [uncultured Enterococcus sp.]
MKRFRNKIDYRVIGVLLLFSLLTVFPYFLNNFIYHQDDIFFHRTRLESYYEAVKQLDFFPRVFSGMGENYGYAADLFYPSILTLPFAVFRLLGMSFVTSFFLYQFLLSLTTAVIAYKVMKMITGSTYQGLFFSIFYTTATYRLIDQSIRGALGETMAFCFLPLIVYAIYRIVYDEKDSWLPLAVGMSLLIASHLITAFYTTIFIAMFLFTHINLLNKGKFFSFLKAGVASTFLSAWFLLPYLEQTLQLTFNFTKAKLWLIGLDFTLADLLGNSLSNIGKTSEALKPNFGLLILCVIIYALLNYKKLKDSEKRLTIATVALIIASTNLFFWASFQNTFLSVIQFEWRLLIFVTLFGGILATKLLFQQVKKPEKAIFLFSAFLIFVLTYSFNVQTMEISASKNSYVVTNENYTEFQQGEIGHGREYLVKDTDTSTYFQNSTPKIDNTVYLSHSTQQHSYKTSDYQIELLNDAVVQLPKFFYIGYTVFVDDKRMTNYEKDGLLTVDIPAGSHDVKVVYSGTTIQQVSVWLSLLTAVGLFAFWLKESFIAKKGKHAVNSNA